MAEGRERLDGQAETVIRVSRTAKVLADHLRRSKFYEEFGRGAHQQIGTFLGRALKASGVLEDFQNGVLTPKYPEFKKDKICYDLAQEALARIYPGAAGDEIYNPITREAIMILYDINYLCMIGDSLHVRDTDRGLLTTFTNELSRVSKTRLWQDVPNDLNRFQPIRSPRKSYKGNKNIVI